jgi:hypothetical protein
MSVPPPSIGLGAKAGTCVLNLHDEIDDDSADVWITRPPFSASNALHRGLYALEQKLRCDVCQELFKVPVTLRQCGHTFCNHCIQRHAETVKQSTKRIPGCPKCRQQFSDADLKPNSAVEQIKFSYQAIRSQLMQALQEVFANTKQQAEESDNKRSTRKRSHQDYAECSGTESSSDSSVHAADVLRDIDGNKKQLTMTKRAKTSYNSLKKKQLKELCQKEGLPTTGTDEELKARHRAFITLYNVECDSTRPRSKRELLRDFLKQEQTGQQEAKKVAKETKSLKTLLKRRATEGAPLSSGDEALDKKLKDGFDKLIAEARSKRDPSLSAAVRPKNNPPSTSESNAPKELQSSSRSATLPLLTNDANGATTPDPLGLGSRGPSPISHQSSQSTVGLSQPPEMVDKLVANSRRGSRQTPYAAHTTGSGYSAEVTEVPAFLKSPGRNDNAMASASADASNHRATAESMQPPPNRAIAKKSTKPPIATHQTKRKGKPLAKTGIGPKRARKPTVTADQAAARRSGRSIVGPWICQACTYYNEERTYSTAKCAMCENRRSLNSYHSQDDATVSL